jgi:hypothetical protein
MSAPAFVQEKDGSVTGTTLAVAFGSANVAGNFIVVTFNTVPPDVSVTDTRGNTYHQAVTDGAGVTIFYAWNIAAGANTVTAKWSTSNSYAMAILEWSGVQTAADPIDGTNVGSGSSALASSGTVTPSRVNDLVVGMIFFGNGGIAPGSGFTVRWNFNFGGNFEEDTVAATTAPIAATATCTSGSWSAVVAAFKSQLSTARQGHLDSSMGMGLV